MFFQYQFCISEWADKLTEMAKGKHHIGDFLPPEELERFMETYQVIITFHPGFFIKNGGLLQLKLGVIRVGINIYLWA